MAVTQASGGAGVVPPSNATTDHGNINTPNSADLNQAARDYCAAQGWAMPDSGYPIRPADLHGADDAASAVKAVGRGGADHDTIRRHVISRLHAIGQSDMIPDNWNAKGALTDGSDAGMRSALTLEAAGRLRLYRIASDLELQPGGDGRTIVGYAVPFDKPQRIDDNLVESFDAHSIDHQIRAMHHVEYYNLHSVHGGVSVGHIKYARSDPAGLYTESYISPDDPHGDRTLDEIRSGIKPHQSVGFEVRQGGTEYRGGVAHRMKVTLTELAAVPVGAYGDAASIAGVRSVAGTGEKCPSCGHAPGFDRMQEAAALLASLPRIA